MDKWRCKCKYWIITQGLKVYLEEGLELLELLLNQLLREEELLDLYQRMARNWFFESKVLATRALYLTPLTSRYILDRSNLFNYMACSLSLSSPNLDPEHLLQLISINSNHIFSYKSLITQQVHLDNPDWYFCKIKYLALFWCPTFFILKMREKKLFCDWMGVGHF